MYFPIGWPKVIKIPELGQWTIRQITCNRDRILFAILGDDSLAIWFCKPCVPIVFHRRTPQSLDKFGTNVLAEWKPDSSMIVIATSEGHLLFYKLGVVVTDQKGGLYNQTDSPHANLRRDSAELFIKETIPPLHLTLSEEVMVWDGRITGIVCITMTELMVATSEGHVLRYRWDGTQARDYNLDLRRIPFCINQQVSKAIPIVEENTYIIDIEYSPLAGGFSIVLNDGRAAFLTASSLKFDPNQVQGIWAQGIEDATCTTMNHKYRLITFGRTNSECIVYCVDESNGGLEVSHNCVLSSKDYPGDPGAVEQILWTPDGCALVASWSKGGLAMWSTFGALLMCSLGWDYGLNIDIIRHNPLQVLSMQFATEGYQLWIVRKETTTTNQQENHDFNNKNNLIQLDFVKTALTINPCMSHQSHLYLQGEDKLYVNSADSLIKLFAERSGKDDNNSGFVGVGGGDSISASLSSTLAEGRQWLVIPVPSTYSATNWPIRYSAIDGDGQNMAIAGRTGLAHYSMQSRRWKLFGNETQEKDFVVAGGLLWWRDYIVMSCYSILENSDELRFYPRDTKLDNRFAKIVKVHAPILLINILQDQLITVGSDAQVCIWALKQNDSVGDVDIVKVQAVDISAVAVHPACIASITLTSLRTEIGQRGGQRNNSESIVLNVSGRLLMVQREVRNGERYTCLMPTVLASCVENVWVPGQRRADKAHLTEALWLFCGSHGMRVWLPLYPRGGDKSHTFMSKRIMLPFHLRIYPLAILFEDAIILGAENDTILYTSDSNSPFSLPFNILQRTSQVYLHQILRQLIRRNLGYHAWEIARSCMSLPYFPHSLELLLHEVLEEEATSKEPIPDAQLPSVIEFIMEFPVYLQTVVQCARKTEIALWPYLFSAAGKPKDLFQECMAKTQLDTAASYLIILQNLETSSVSRQYATLLLNTALDRSKWELAKELVRFLRAIDPNDVESPRNSLILPSKLGGIQTPQQLLTPPIVSSCPNAEDLSLILGNVQGPRVRSYSTTISPKSLLSGTTGSTSGTGGSTINNNAIIINESHQSNNNNNNNNSGVIVNNKLPSTSTSIILGVNNNSSNSTAEEFFIDVILQKHARRLLSAHRLIDLGYFAAHLDFHLVVWLVRERDRAARIDDFVYALKQLHDDFHWPYPTIAATDSIIEISSSYPHNLKVDNNYCSHQHSNNNNNNNNSRVGDSGYMSFHGLPGGGGGTVGDDLITPLNTLDNNDNDDDSQLIDDTELLLSINDDGVKDVVGKTKATTTTLICDKKIDLFSNNHPISQDQSSVVSTMSSVWGGGGGGVDDNLSINNGNNNSTTTNWEVPSTQILEQLSNASNKGSHRSEVQLRYLLQLFMEASCLEWSLLISVLLKDAMAVVRTVNVAKSPDQSIEAVTRLRQGLLLLNHWTNRECLGYKAFMLAIQNQISVLSKILETKVQQQKIIDYQRAVSATLNKVSTVTLSTTNNKLVSRSRKSSSAIINHNQQQQQQQQDSSCSGSTTAGTTTTSQCGSRKVGILNSNSTNSNNNNKLNNDVNNSVSINLNNNSLQNNENMNDDDDDAVIIPESTGCVIC